MDNKLILREATRDDFSDYFAHKSEASDIYWNGFEGKPNKEGLSKAFMSRIGNHDSELPKVIYVLDYNCKYVGYVQFTKGAEEEIGFGVREEFQGKGFGTKAVRLAVEITTQSKTDRAIFARVRDDNSISQKCFLKNGFTRTDIAEAEVYYPIEKPVLLRRYVLNREQ